MFFNKGYFKSSRSGGFTLVELAVLLVIISLVAVGALTMRENKAVVETSKDTLKHLHKLKLALGKYARANGHLPCPSDPKLTINDNNFGKDVRADATADCSAALESYTPDTAIEGECADKIFSGMVPIKELGLNLDDMVDSWGRRITYAVGGNMTKTTTYDYASNAIKLLRKFKRASTGSTLTTDGDGNTTGDIVIAPVGFILLSYGPDGVGAYPFDGGVNMIKPRRKDAATALVDSDLHRMNHRISPDYSIMPLTNVFAAPNAKMVDDIGVELMHFDDILVAGRKKGFNVAPIYLFPDSTATKEADYVSNTEPKNNGWGEYTCTTTSMNGKCGILKVNMDHDNNAGTPDVVGYNVYLGYYQYGGCSSNHNSVFRKTVTITQGGVYEIEAPIKSARCGGCSIETKFTIDGDILFGVEGPNAASGNPAFVTRTAQRYLSAGDHIFEIGVYSELVCNGTFNGYLGPIRMLYSNPA